MKHGTTYKFGDIVLIEVPFVDKYNVKLRPALVLFEELDNVIVAGITSDLSMKGILIPKEESLIVNSVVKLNYIFTISKMRIKRLLIHLSGLKKKETCEKLIKKFSFCLKTQWKYLKSESYRLDFYQKYLTLSYYDVRLLGKRTLK